MTHANAPLTPEGRRRLASLTVLVCGERRVLEPDRGVRAHVNNGPATSAATPLYGALLREDRVQVSHPGVPKRCALLQVGPCRDGPLHRSRARCAPDGNLAASARRPRPHRAGPPQRQ